MAGRQMALQIEGMAQANVCKGSKHSGFGRQFSGPEDCSGWLEGKEGSS